VIRGVDNLAAGDKTRKTIPTVHAAGPLTDSQLRRTPVPVIDAAAVEALGSIEPTDPPTLLSVSIATRNEAWEQTQLLKNIRFLLMMLVNAQADANIQPSDFGED
jgi:hypothetical protein